MATLAVAERMHVSFRSVDCLLQDGFPQCAVTRCYIAPDQIRSTWFDCNPVAEPQRSDLVQAGTRAYGRRPHIADGAWAKADLVLRARCDVPELIGGWMHLP